jgi:hypothetical protein
MSNENDRTPPDDPSSITLTYQHRHYWWFSADTAPETWHVSADIDDGGPHVGDMDITLVDIYETHDPFALLDGQDAELGHVAGTIFDAGDGQITATRSRSRPGAPRSGPAAGRDGDQEAVRRSPRCGLLPRPAQRTD